MAYSRLLLVAVLSVVILSGHCAKTDAVSRETKVQILNDSNFGGSTAQDSCAAHLLVSCHHPPLHPADELTASGTWFVNLFAPWCGHCRQLAPTWDEFPRYLASFKQELPDAHVGKVDGTQSLVLVSRFRVEGYPSLYLLKGGRAWLYQGPRTLKAMKDFMVEGHEKEEPLPLVKTPNSSIGRLLGVLHRQLAVLHCGCSVPYKVLEAYKALKAQHGWSDMGILGAVLAVPVITGAATICLVDALFYRRARDGAEEDLVAAEAVPAAPLDANAQQEGEELRQGQ
ncbi:hypothetical protein QJQ45_030153 [Haematococcus lacustris]|nr:hypothetical protein QJQ45_030153 [Haematococcus lacustris]